MILIIFNSFIFKVGNKVDEPAKRVVPEADVRRFAESLRINYFETSAKENLNVEQVISHKFLKIIRKLNCNKFFVRITLFRLKN